MQHEVYGATGLRQEELQKIMPKEMTPELTEHVSNTTDKIKNTLDSMRENPEEYSPHNVKELDRQYTNVLNAQQSNSPLEVYNALNEFKRYSQGTYDAMQRISTFDMPYKFLSEVNGLSKEVRTSLED